MKASCQPARRGFLLLEMVLALAVFGCAVTGFVVALHRMSSIASLAQSELRITRILDSAMDETLSLPAIEEGKFSSMAGNGVELNTTIELIQNMVSYEGQPLVQMFHISISARWYANGQWQTRTAETWRYGPMYQPQ